MNLGSMCPAARCTLSFWGLLLTLSACAGEPADPAQASLAWKSEGILRGHPATEGERWGTVALIVEYGDTVWGCTGTLIGPDLVVTAAHCVLDDESGEQVKPATVTVIAGAADEAAASYQQKYAVRHLAAHERAYAGPFTMDPTGIGIENDIAIVETARPVTQVVPVAILPLARVDELIHEGTELIVAGYGTRSLHPDGSSSEDGLHYVGTVPWVRRSEGEFLAGDAVGSDTCPGDSGGPVYLSAEGTIYLVGATSRGRDDFQTVDCGQGGVYTLVPAYVDWIDSHRKVQATSPDANDESEASDAGTLDGSTPGVAPANARRKRHSGCGIHPAPPTHSSTVLSAGLLVVCWLALRRHVRV